MFSKMLLDFPEKSFKLLHWGDYEWSYASAPKVCWDFSSDVLARRMRHTAKWCLQNRQPFSFQHVEFNAEPDGEIFVIRDFQFSLIESNRVLLDVSIASYSSTHFFSDSSEGHLIDSLSDAIVVAEAEPIDVPGPRIIFVNKTFEKMTGYQSRDVLGKTPRILQGPKTCDKTRQKIRTCLSNFQEVNETLVNYTKDGQDFVVDLKISPVKDGTGWCTHWIAVQSDVSKQQSIVDSELQSQLVLNATGIASWTYDLTERKLHWGAGMYHLYGIDPSEFSVAYNDWERMIHPEDRVHTISYIETCFKKGVGINIEFRIITNNHEVKQIRALSSFVKDEMTGVRRMVGVNMDITAEKEASNEIERQRAVAYEKSRLASLGELAAGIGHEINNPLSIISLTLDLVELGIKNNRLDNEALASKLNAIKDASSRIGNIVSGLRSVSWSQPNNNQNNDLNLTESLSDTLTMFCELYKNDDIEMTTSFPDESCFVAIDHSSLQQVLINLLTNAKDSTDSLPDRKIEVSIESTDQYWRLIVADNGFGIADDIRDNIFNPFFTTKEVGMGTGLGLSITQSLVESANGKLSLLSTGFTGSRFALDLPKSVQKAPAREPSTSNDKTKHQKSLNVLIVEDDCDLREVLSLLLETFNCQVDIAKNGLEGVENVRRSSEYDIIFSDIKMPSCDGIEFLRIIDKENLKDNTKFYFMTGDITSYDKQELESLGIDGVLLKPLKYEALATLLDK